EAHARLLMVRCVRRALSESPSATRFYRRRYGTRAGGSSTAGRAPRPRGRPVRARTAATSRWPTTRPRGRKTDAIAATARLGRGGVLGDVRPVGRGPRRRARRASRRLARSHRHTGRRVVRVDLALVVDEPDRYLGDDRWVEAFGKPLLTFLEPVGPEYS